MGKKIAIPLLFVSVLLIAQYTLAQSSSENGSEISNARMLKELRAISSQEASNHTTQYLTKDGAFTLLQKNGVRELIIHPKTSINKKRTPEIIIYSYPQNFFPTGLALGRTIICSSISNKNKCIDITVSYLDPMSAFTKAPLPKSYFGLTRREIMQLTNQYLPTNQRLANIILAYERELKNGPLYNYLKVDGSLRCVGWAKDKDDFIKNRLIFYGCYDASGYKSGSMGTAVIIKSSRSYYSKLTPFSSKVILLARNYPFSPYALKFLNSVESIEQEYILSLNEEPILP